jgi:16S rRNA (cytosine1402-N4)-methyltransferase
VNGRSETQSEHEPVMAAEVVTLLNPGRAGLFVDCTVGGGGHARALLAEGAGRVLGLDRDAEALSIAARRLGDWGDRIELAQTDFRKLEAVLAARGIEDIDGGALADLGFSTLQLEGEGRGFSFRRDEPLDMRMDRSTGPTAADVLESASERQLADVLFRFGEERHARRIARAVVASRDREPMTTTGQLAALVRRTLPRPRQWRIDPATRTFQALRIWVNRELEGLDAWLLALCRRLRAGARLAVVTFHSLEDRIVKQALRRFEQGADVAIRVLTRRPLRPSRDEVVRNPRARSAKLRAAERLA